MDSIKDLISVIMPAYNAELFIREAIESVLNQTYTNLELIIVEDCSNDRTLEIIESIKDERIKVYHNMENKGISYSTNYGIRMSKGEYIALLDDDDVALPERLDISIQYLKEHPDISIAGGGMEMIDECGKHIGEFVIPRRNYKLVKAILLFDTWVGNCSTIIRREVFDKYNIWYKEDCCGMQDMQFYIEASKCVKLAGFDEVVLKHRYHDNNESLRQMQVNNEKRLQKFAQMQRFSIEQEGFLFSEDEYRVITDNMTEPMKKKYKVEDMKNLYTVFKKMVLQAEERQLDWTYELRWLLRKKIVDRLSRTDFL